MSALRVGHSATQPPCAPCLCKAPSWPVSGVEGVKLPVTRPAVAADAVQYQHQVQQVQTAAAAVEAAVAAAAAAAASFMRLGWPVHSSGRQPHIYFKQWRSLVATVHQQGQAHVCQGTTAGAAEPCVAYVGAACRTGLVVKVHAAVASRARD
jgi:hypothetical protein